MKFDPAIHALDPTTRASIRARVWVNAAFDKAGAEIDHWEPAPCPPREIFS